MKKYRLIVLKSFEEISELNVNLSDSQKYKIVISDEIDITSSECQSQLKKNEKINSIFSRAEFLIQIPTNIKKNGVKKQRYPKFLTELVSESQLFNDCIIQLYPTMEKFLIKNNIGSIDDYFQMKRKNTHNGLLYINMTNRGRPHRIKLLDRLYETNLFELGKNTYVAPKPQYDKQYTWRHLTTKFHPIGENITNEYLTHDCLLEIVTETNPEFIRFTEKTFKAILSLKPFLILGGKNIHKELNNLGFKLYHEIFDYSFDDESDIDYRIDGIIENLKKLKDKNYTEIHKKIQEKTIYNFNHLINLYMTHPSNKEFFQDMTFQNTDIQSNLYFFEWASYLTKNLQK